MVVFMDAINATTCKQKDVTHNSYIERTFIQYMSVAIIDVYRYCTLPLTKSAQVFLNLC